MSRCRRIGFVTLALLAACAAMACTDRELAARQRLSLVWISLDTLRADHLSLHGYPRDTTPFIDELARDGAYVEWAVAPSPRRCRCT